MTQASPDTALHRDDEPPHPALIALVRLLARQAAREACVPNELRHEAADDQTQ